MVVQFTELSSDQSRSFTPCSAWISLVRQPFFDPRKPQDLLKESWTEERVEATAWIHGQSMQRRATLLASG